MLSRCACWLLQFLHGILKWMIPTDSIVKYCRLLYRRNDEDLRHLLRTQSARDEMIMTVEAISKVKTFIEFTVRQLYGLFVTARGVQGSCRNPRGHTATQQRYSRVCISKYRNLRVCSKGFPLRYVYLRNWRARRYVRKERVCGSHGHHMATL